MMRRALLVLLIVLCVPLVLLAALGTATVRDLVIEEVLSATDGSVEAAEGNLLGTLELRGLQLAGDSLAIERLRLRWEPAALLRGELLIERLALDGPRLAITAGSDNDRERGAFAGLRLPLPVRIEELVLRDAAVGGLAGLESVKSALTTSLFARGSRIEFRGLDLALRHPEEGTLRALGTAALELEPALPWDVDLRLALAPTAFEELELAVEAAGDLTTARADVALLDPWPAGIQLESDDLARGAFRALVTIRDPIAIGDLRLLQARIEAEGDPGSATLEAEAELELADPLGAGRLRLATVASARVDPQRITYTLSGVAPEFEVGAEGSTALDGFATRAALRLDVRDGRRWLPARALAFEARADVDLPAPLDAERPIGIEDLTVRGTLDLRPLTVAGGARLRLGHTVSAEHLNIDLHLGPNQVLLRGSAGERLDLELDIEAPDLRDLAPQLAGSATAHARLGGARDAPTLVLDGALNDLALDDARLEALAVDASFDAAAARPLRLGLDAHSLTHPSLPAPLAFAVDAAGQRDALVATLRGTLGADTLATRLELAVDGDWQALRGRLDSLDLETALFGHWALDGASTLSLDRDARSIDLAAACLRSEDARLCSEPLRVALPTDAPPRIEGLALRLDALPFARLDRWLPPSVGVDGVLSGRASLAGGELKATVVSRDAGLSLRDPATGEELFADRLAEGDVEFRRIDDRLSGAVRLRLDTAGSASLTGTLRSDPSAERFDDLDLRATLAIDELAFLAPLVPALDAPTGHLEGALEIRGSSEDPIVTGQLSAGGEAFVAALGRTLAVRELELQGSARDGVRFAGDLLVDESVLTFDGSADYAESRGVTASLALSGRDAQVVALPDLALWVSPDLEATLADDIVDLRGRLHLPRARIAITSVPASGPTRSSDLVLHRPAQITRERALRTRADVDLSLGDDVQLIAGSLRTRLIGSLELALGLDASLTARGLIETRGGSVARFGKELAIARGRLAFDGPIARPDLDVTATRAIGTREVGVTISGPPDALQTALFSSPPTDDATALTMLVTGREPSQASQEDVDRVSAAALGLGVGVANPVLQELGERFGIDEFGIDTGTGTGAVVAGRRLSERLYARYAYTLATRTSGLQLEYQLSERLSARTETGPVTALDLLYRREFD